MKDTVGLKARAWHDRFVIRDIIDLHAVASTFSYIDLEHLARRHDPDLETILDHLAGVSVFLDEDFAAYALDEPEIADLRSWVTGRYDDLARPLQATWWTGKLVRDEAACGNRQREPLKHGFQGYWSRRITDEHRFAGDAVVEVAAGGGAAASHHTRAMHVECIIGV